MSAALDIVAGLVLFTVGYAVGGIVEIRRAMAAMTNAKAAYARRSSEDVGWKKVVAAYAPPNEKAGWQKVVEVDRALRENAQKRFEEG